MAIKPDIPNLILVKAVVKNFSIFNNSFKPKVLYDIFYLFVSSPEYLIEIVEFLLGRKKYFRAVI